MQKIAFLLVLLYFLSSSKLYSQVSINTTGTAPDASAMLDVGSTSKGLLLPRMTTTQRNAISLPATGLVIYNSTAPGLQVNIGTPASPVWTTLSSSAGWQINGNSGTTASTSAYGSTVNNNFIGTTDGNDFVFATDNLERMRITSGGYVGIGTSSPNKPLYVVGNTSNSNVLTIQNTNNGGYSSVDMYNNTGTLSGTFGFGNAGTGVPFTSRGYFNTYGNDFIIMNSASATPVMTFQESTGRVGVYTLTPAQTLEIAPTNGTVRIDGLQAGNSYNSSATNTNSALVYVNKTTGDLYSLPTVNNATLVTDGTGVPSWSTSGGSGSGWSLTGNSGTTPGTNFLGTTDSKALEFKVNNVVSGYIGVSSTGGTLFGNNASASGTAGTAIGSSASASATYATAIGTSSTASTTYSIAIGYNAQATGGTSNFIAIGNGASVTGGGSSRMIAIGYGAYISGTSSDNISMGSAAYVKGGGISGGIAIGDAAYISGTNDNNLAIGTGAYVTGGGIDNAIVIGNGANVNGTNDNNIAIGNGAAVTGGGVTNSVALGNGATIAASNTIVLGNSSIKYVRSAGTYTTLSDGRFKTNIHDNVPGLDFILKLKPITYHLNIHKLDAYKEGYADSNYAREVKYSPLEEAAVKSKESIQYSGFIAQDVEKAAEKIGYNFSGVHKPENNHDTYGLGYAYFVVPLVKSVQELSKENDALKKKVDELEAIVEQLVKKDDLKEQSN